ncbi:hypothetical protein HanHA300_Chr09g0316651 [Helianthus annuus]|nr:hypothetical protein HanHA300_Chr09g0316651 [Helianthus annuus]KAJ0892912.1 hypothetical protein HanPSC8_Chr09g0371621 [Helianthus annuus]
MLFGEFRVHIRHVCGKKRDKSGSRFGFASFREVKDIKELEKSLKGVKMGDSKLKINLARFAVENNGFSVHHEPPPNKPYPPGAEVKSFRSSYRDDRSFTDVLGKSKVTGEWPVFGESSMGLPSSGKEMSLVIPDKTEAFSGLFGSAVVGRTVDLETLVDFDRLLGIAKIKFSRIQYLGGLSILISFLDEGSAKEFLESKDLWARGFLCLKLGTVSHWPWRGWPG